MENYIVKALINFDDVEKKVKREKDKSIWNCTKERYEFLKSHNAVMLMGIEEIKEEKPIEEKVNELGNPVGTRKLEKELLGLDYISELPKEEKKSRKKN